MGREVKKGMEAVVEVGDFEARAVKTDLAVK